VAQLIEAQLIRRDKGGSRPRYYLMPAHMVQGCEGYVVAPLTANERALYSRLLKSKSKDKSTLISNKQNLDLETACSLVIKGHAAQTCQNEDYTWFAGIERPITSTVETAPEWIWIPNAIVEGIDDETPPIELIRQSNRPAALRLLVDLYGAQTLADHGGVH
jgi:hypothetical protein